ncbi:class I SAM-dependent methyltransferase [Vibrio sp. S4M6]|uniref:class I SAM-dependent methyltransferase n=1 Tax=Vibrio sinus TaxID=2946865 RepID=UPI00202A086C|nr:class I SAM-dependent methyltransferase [Vibrio sinus]MCL9783028.1 class I SAM-dependent methyltransferase [Vibrio sinus]
MNPKTGLEFGTFPKKYDAGRKHYSNKLLDFLPKQGTVLEVGAGTGKGTDLLNTLPISLTVSEPNKSMCNMLIDKFPNLPVLAKAFNDVSSRYDYVVGFQCWHWFGEEKYTTLRKLARHGGYFIWRWYELQDAKDIEQILVLYSDKAPLENWLTRPYNERVSKICDEVTCQQEFQHNIQTFQFPSVWTIQEYINHAQSRIDHQEFELSFWKALETSFKNKRIRVIESYCILNLY